MSAPTDALRLLGQIARVTRLITTDTIGQELIHRPIDQWVALNVPQKEIERVEWILTLKDCDWCASFHVAFWTLVIEQALNAPNPSRTRRALRRAWRLLGWSLAASHAVGLAVGLEPADSTDTDEEPPNA